MPRREVLVADAGAVHLVTWDMHTHNRNKAESTVHTKLINSASSQDQFPSCADFDDDTASTSEYSSPRPFESNHRTPTPLAILRLRKRAEQKQRVVEARASMKQRLRAVEYKGAPPTSSPTWSCASVCYARREIARSREVER
jgi:hypothetical protein